MATINTYMSIICSFCKTNLSSHSAKGGHNSVCRGYLMYVEDLIQTQKVRKDYEEGESISSLCEKYNISRGSVEGCILKSGGKLLGFNYSKIHRTKRIDKIQKTLKSRYGVINPGQIAGNGYQGLNRIPYDRPTFVEDFNIYRDKVGIATKKTLSKIEKPDACDITGIRFADERGKVNPNDYFKRSIDHKKSILECFMDGNSVEEAAGESNIIFVLKYINSIKGSLCSYKEMYAKRQKIINMLVDEN